MRSGRCALSASELMRRHGEHGCRRELGQGCGFVEAIVPAVNGHNATLGMWLAAKVNAQRRGDRRDSPSSPSAHASGARSSSAGSLLVMLFSSRVARRVTPPAKRGQGSA
jgi:hypothetical protein